MLVVYTNNSKIEELLTIIKTEAHLDEVVQVKNEEESIEVKNYLIVRENSIIMPLRWSNEIPPYLFPCFEFSSDSFLAIVFLCLNNFEKAYEYSSKNKALNKEIDLFNCLQHGILLNSEVEYSNDEIDDIEKYRITHNKAILSHYGNTQQYYSLDRIEENYKLAFEIATSNEHKAFTGKHFATLLLDNEDFVEAEKILQLSLELAVSEQAEIEILAILYTIWIQNLSIPYETEQLEKIENTMNKIVDFYQKNQDEIQMALVFLEKGHIETLKEDYSNGLKSINLALDVFEKENIPELIANANYKKGTLLYSWAQKGNPQFFKAAAEAYQKSLHVFSAENTPEVFAEIQHHLGIIYSEIPDEVKVKSMWAAVSVSSFNSAIQYFTPEAFPYEYAKICNSFGNAYTKYPSAVKFDNFQKALELYRKALEIRTSSEFPTERAITIINFLEAALHVSNANEVELLDEMTRLANEIEHLTKDPVLLSEYKNHLENLEKLKNLI